MPSDVVTWEACPGCGGPVAVGWVGGAVTEIDCPAGCRLTEAHRAVVEGIATPPDPDRPGSCGPPICCPVGRTTFPESCPVHGPQVPGNGVRLPPAE